MDNSSNEHPQWHLKERPQPKIIELLLRPKAKISLWSPHAWLIAVIMAGLGYIYYNVVTTFFDIYVILFFYPIIYAAIVYRLRGVLGSGLVALVILLPHAVVAANDPYSLIRLILFVFFSFLIGGLVATQLNYLEHQLEAYQEIVYLNKEMSNYINLLQSTQQQLIHAEKLNAMGQLAASVAHEINNPLAGILVYSKLLAKKLSNDSLDKTEALTNLAKMESAVGYCSNIVRRLLDFARQSEPVLKPVAVSDVIDQVLSLVGHQAEMKKIKVVREEMPGLPLVFGDSGQLQQVFINLIINAIQATSDGGKITIRTWLGYDGHVRVSVQDTGCGIPRENLAKIFTPFFTTKKEAKGSGLGLAVSHGIVERHGGKIEVESEVDKGSTFTVFLPVYKGEEKAPR